jgi:hypothetical protein
MSVTKAIPREELQPYFAEFTRRFFTDGSPEAVEAEVIELEFELDAGDHRIFDPQEVWAIEEQDGFLSALAVDHPNGTREVVSLQRVGLRRLH